MTRDEEELLRSFLEELEHAEPSLQACLFDRYAEEYLKGTNNRSRLCQDEHLEQFECETTQQQQSTASWNADALRGKLRELSGLPVSDEGSSFGTTAASAVQTPTLAATTPPGLVYSTVDALVRFATRLLPLVNPSTTCISAVSQARETPRTSPDHAGRTPAPPSPRQRRRRRHPSSPSALAKTLLDLTLLCLANLLESPPWRHIFFRVLHGVQREQQARRQQLRPSSRGGASDAAGDTTVQEYLWRRVVAGDAASGSGEGERAKPAVKPSTSPSLPRPLPVSDHAAVRLCCTMVRHCPLSFPASSYAALAPHLVDYLLDHGGDGGGAAAAAAVTTTDEEGLALRNGLMVQLDLFAACARGSPHFRQYIKGLRRKRELFRRLLVFLGPRYDGRVVVRALCALTRVLAGDPLEGKVFDRGNALETASLVMGNLLDLSGSTSSERIGYASHLTPEFGRGGIIGEQRRYAEVASDIARSPVFMSVLLDTGRLALFLREAVAVLARAAADVYGLLSTEGASTNAEGRAGSPKRSSDLRVSQQQQQQQQRQRVGYPEPLLGALCSFCLEHSPARSTFIQALLGSGSDSDAGTGGASGLRTSPPVVAATSKSGERIFPCSSDVAAAAAANPCAALFLLCLHPHQPSAAAASTLLQCLLVGGGALGAVSGPSPGAAAGVGVIPAGFCLTPTSVDGGGGGIGGRAGAFGIGREDPLQAALLERIGEVALGTAGRNRRASPSTDRNGGEGVQHKDRVGANDNVNGKRSSFSREYGGGFGEGWESGAESSGDDSSGSGAQDDEDGSDGWYGCGIGVSLDSSGAAAVRPGAPSPSPTWPEGGALGYLIPRLRQVGGDLASAIAHEQLGLVEPVTSRRLSAAAGEASASPCGAPCSAREEGAGKLKARGVEVEQDLTSVLCLLSSLALAVPVAGRALAFALPLDDALAPILAAQRSILSGADPVDYPRAPVEIVLVTLTLVAQLGVELSGCGDGVAACEVVVDAKRGQRSRRASAVRRERRRERRHAARAARLRMFLREQAAAGEVKLCLGHAACRAESKDLARRAAALISLLQSGGGVDALMVADSLYAFAQSAESREAALRSRVAAAESLVCRERAAGARRAAALEESEGLVAQIEARNAQDLRKLSEQECDARRRAEEAHARALMRGEVALRRAEDAMADLERVLSSKEEALRSAERENRAKDLEIAALKGDLAGEQRIGAAVNVKLEEATSERDEALVVKMEVSSLLDATKAELSKVREEGLASAKGWEDERASAARGWAAAREAEEGLERSNARVEEAYGKLILLARGYKKLEEDARCKAVQAERSLVQAETQIKLLQEQLREEERRHCLTKDAVKDGEASLRRAEQRLVEVSREAAEAQAAASAAKAASRELMEKVASTSREVALRRDEVSDLRAELERSRMACAEKDLKLASLTKELDQQAGIIDYINKLSSNAAPVDATSCCTTTRKGLVPVSAATAVAAVALNGGEKVTQVPDSGGGVHAV